MNEVCEFVWLNMQENYGNAMATDAVVPCIVRPSADIILDK